ncbi:MAG: hypothetical protein ABSB95_05935 [Dissulfurispiraceae bacterium]|jgi:N-acetylglucosamine-6-phosphate deacetylase
MKVIDVHTHGIGGHDTRSGSEKHILEIAETQGFLGVQEIVPTIYPAAIKVMRQNMAAVRKAMEQQKAPVACPEAGCAEARRDPGVRTRKPAKIMGVNIEGPFLNPSRCGALDATAFLEPAEYYLGELIEGFEDIVKIITVAPEMNGAAGIIKKIADKGIIPCMGHSEATYNEAATGFNAGARCITHIFNAMRCFHHREPGIAGFGLLNREVYIEVIADPYHLHRAVIDLIFKVKDPSRIIIVSDLVKESKVSMHALAVANSKGVLLGGSMSVRESADRLIEIGFGKNAVMKCVTVNPGRYLRAYSSQN